MGHACGAVVSQASQRLVEYAPVVLSAVPAVWVAVTWDAEPSLAFPVVASAFPLLARTGLLRLAFRGIAAVLLMLFVIIGMMSVGHLFVPATLAMLLSVVWATVAAWKADRA